MWKNIVQRVRPQMTIWRMRMACWITNADVTQSEYVTLSCFSTAIMFARMRNNVTLYVQYSTVQYSTVQYSTVQYSTVQYSTCLVFLLL